MGIGSTSPSARLDIVGSSVAKPGIEINTTDTGDTNFGMVIKGATNTERAIGFYDNNALAWWFGRDNGGDIQNGIGFWNPSIGWALAIKDNGNIGIGASNPQSKLHVVASNADEIWDYSALSSNIALEVGENGNGNLGTIKLNSYDSGHFVFLRPSNGNYHVDSTRGYYYFNWDEDVRGGNHGVLNIANESGGHTVQLHTAGNTFFNGGNVGIGDSSPNHKLDVAGNIGLDGNIHFGDDGTPEISFANHTYGDATYIGGGGNTIVGSGEFAQSMKSLVSVSSEDLYLGADSNIYLFTYTDTIANRKQALKADTSGRVFVGSGSSSSIGYSTNVFNVVTPYGTGTFGSLNTSWFHMDSSTGLFYFNDPAHANGGFHTYSDERYKTNITLIPNALNKLNKFEVLRLPGIEISILKRNFCLACSMVLLHKKLLRFSEMAEKVDGYYTMQYSN